MLYMVQRALTGQTRYGQTRSVFLKQKSCRKTILVKNDLFTCGDLNCDLILKITEVVSE